jgi:DNA-binding NarL/FixJ family response regulator
LAVRVFLVEDLKAMRELVRDLLDSVGGYELVAVAATETAATDWLLHHRGQWDLAIFDLLLQEGSGFTLLSRCHGEPGKVVVFSDFVTPVIRERCLRMGADAVLDKGNFLGLRDYLKAFQGRMRAAAA